MDKGLVYLTQTDTTVGFLSQDDRKLSRVKQRDPNKKTLQVVDSFHTLQQNIRVPKRFRKRVRGALKTTFIYPNKKALRVVDSKSLHYPFVHKFHKLYSTSANVTQHRFDEEFAINSADVVVYNAPFEELAPSSLVILTKLKIKQIR